MEKEKYIELFIVADDNMVSFQRNICSPFILIKL